VLLPFYMQDWSPLPSLPHDYKLLFLVYEAKLTSLLDEYELFPSLRGLHDAESSFFLLCSGPVEEILPANNKYIKPVNAESFWKLR
jgi:hypothetical protein